jgi:cbb3-type cytochrome oxidase subunit 3
MMFLSALRPDASLAEFLAYRARSASIRRLSLDLVVGLAGGAAALWWRPSAWLVLVSLALCFFAYGAWGLADRARSRVATQGNRFASTSLDALCAAMGVVGVLATAGLLLGVWAIALGTWIS